MRATCLNDSIVYALDSITYSMIFAKINHTDLIYTRLTNKVLLVSVDFTPETRLHITFRIAGPVSSKYRISRYDKNVIANYLHIKLKGSYYF